MERDLNDSFKHLQFSLARAIAGVLLPKVCGLWTSGICIISDVVGNWESQALPQTTRTRMCILTGLQAGGVDEWS